MARKTIKIKLSVVITFLLLSLACSRYSPSSAWIAEDLRKRGEYQEAIFEYKKHIESKLKQNGNTDAEHNPYFYYLLIGDCYLEIKQFDLAKKSYITAHENKIEDKLVGAKIRVLSEKIEETGQLEKAIILLEENRNLDPLLFDIDIDKLHKKMLETEDKKR